MFPKATSWAKLAVTIALPEFSNPTSGYTLPVEEIYTSDWDSEPLV